MKHRNIITTPSRVFSESFAKTGKFDNTKHALLYQLENKNGSSGGQNNANKLGPIKCLEKTHKAYGARGEGLGDQSITPRNLYWTIVDINKIKDHNKVKNCQYDAKINEMIRDLDPRVKKGVNPDSLVYQVDKNTQRPLTSEEIHEYYDKLFGNGIKKTVHPPDTTQQEIVEERADCRNKNSKVKLIVNLENLHTRLGKDKVNALGLDPDCKVVIDMSGYFATWQVKDELGDDDYWVETQNTSIEKIAKDIIFGLSKGKRIWVPLSTYIDPDHNKVKLLEVFKRVNVAIIIDEPDYQVWKQIDLLPGVIDNVIG